MSQKIMHVCDSCGVEQMENKEMLPGGGLNCPPGWRMFAWMTTIASVKTKELCEPCQKIRTFFDMFPK